MNFNGEPVILNRNARRCVHTGHLNNVYVVDYTCVYEL